MNTYEEHLAHSAPCSSRWDGFDRGTDWSDEPTWFERVIGRMANGAGQRVVIREVEFEAGDCEYSVYVDGDRVFCDLDCRARAIEVARWWMAGCPA